MPDRSTSTQIPGPPSVDIADLTMPLHNKDRLFVVLLDSPIQPGTHDWALLLSPKKSKRGMKESTLYQLIRAPNDKGIIAWEFISRQVDDSSDGLPSLRARFMIIKIKPFQEAFFEEEFYNVPIRNSPQFTAKEWVCDCVDRLRGMGLAEVPTADEVEDAVARWQWDRRGFDEPVADFDLRVRS